MRHHLKRVGILFAASLVCTQGQWLNHRAPGTPRTRDGKPDLSAKPPRASNGKPDLSGVWSTEPAPAGENERLFGPDVRTAAVPGDDPTRFSKYFFNILVDFRPDESPLRPEAAESIRRTALCLPLGLPRADLFNYQPFKIIQTPSVIAVLYEVDNMHRQIYTDGRKLPVDPQPAWLGYSVGKWEGDTLIVDSTGFTTASPLDLMGHPHSEDLRIQERFHRRDFGHMDVSITIDDPKMYTKPFTIKVTEVLIPDSDILETVCIENEKDRSHLGKQ
jgi:hypothetical protein